MNPDANNLQPVASYSTIFQCTEDGFTCTLRVFEGIISLVMLIIFIKGYRVLTQENNNPISKEDKRIYMLAMAQTLILTLYYFLFEEFFVLASIRNLLVWISINVLDVLFRIHWLEDEVSLRKAKWLINFMKVFNFLMWFVIAVGDGSEIVNTSFNLGYNCLIIDWVVLSGILLIITLVEGFFGFQIIERLNWELGQPTTINDPRKEKSLRSEIMSITLLVGGSIGGALIMFIWDYLAYTIAHTDQMCEEIFSGNTFFRKVLCFLLKIISMQVVPTIVYYTIFYKRKDEFLSSQPECEMSDIDFLDDRAPSDLNRTLTSSHTDSRRSLFSGLGSTPNL